MKLYATVTSERASKGQGGNDFIEIELKAFDRTRPVGIVLLEVLRDSEDKPKQYIIQFKDPEIDEEWEILKEGHEDQGTIQTIIKGNKKKDEHDFAVNEPTEQDMYWCRTCNAYHK